MKIFVLAIFSARPYREYHRTENPRHRRRPFSPSGPVLRIPCPSDVAYIMIIATATRTITIGDRFEYQPAAGRGMTRAYLNARRRGVMTNCHGEISIAIAQLIDSPPAAYTVGNEYIRFLLLFCSRRPAGFRAPFEIETVPESGKSQNHNISGAYTNIC